MAAAGRSAWWVLARHLLLAILLGGLATLLVRFRTPRVPSVVPYLLALNAAVIVLIGYLVARAIGQAVRSVLAGTSRSSLVTSVSLFADVRVAVAAGFAIFQQFGIRVESIFLGSAFAGIVLAFASQTLLSNVAAGLTIVFSSPFRVGDRIGLISSSYSVIPPSHTHELAYPT